MHAQEIAAWLQSPAADLWRLSDALARGSDLPRRPGLYAWYFRGLPNAVPTAGCAQVAGWTLAYAGIAPSRATSRQTLRHRIRTHARGNAAASTLRLTLGALLELPAQRAASGRVTFGDAEAKLTAWLDEHARIAWVEAEQPWVHEAEVIRALALPLNLEHNAEHAFSGPLTAMRRAVRVGSVERGV